jgi:arylsulfatase A-like enzyme
MTGMSPRAAGLRTYREGILLPEVPTLAQCFRDAGYQAYAVGKLHVSPQRSRIGFDDVLLEEQGRHQFRDIPDGDADDYELFLAEQGYAGQEYAGGMTQNEWVTRAWHLPEQCHPVNWATREMCKFIRRRDPSKPSFWYLSFSAPHPPLTPPQAYIDLYRDTDPDPPAAGDWSSDFDALPYHIKTLSNPYTGTMLREGEYAKSLARKAFYATITHIDHQIRVVIGYLREAGLLENTIIVFTGDHGHMAGEHGMWCMTPFYEMSAKIPLIVVPPLGSGRMVQGTVDDRIAEFGDIMPTLLDLADIPIPDHVDRLSLAGAETREYLYGEHGEGSQAMRMVRKGRYKLIYYPLGNVGQLFDIENDPDETSNLIGDPALTAAKEELESILAENLYGEDTQWLKNGALVGLPDREFEPPLERGLKGQRGLRFL